MTFWDEEFKELNSIDLSHDQKTKMLQNIKVVTKRRNRFQIFKNVFVISAALALFLILTISLISERMQTKNPSASDPQKHVKINIEQTQQLSKKDSAQWEVVSRLRYDYGVIEKVQTSQKQVVITVKRINSFGSDADPIDTTKPDTDSRTYVLKTSENKQILHLKVNQKVLLLYGQYSAKGSTDTFWAAEVLGNTQKDGKFYNSEGKLVNLTISSTVNVTDGILKVK
jgi:hypothetical protein